MFDRKQPQADVLSWSPRYDAEIGVHFFLSNTGGARDGPEFSCQDGFAFFVSIWRIICAIYMVVPHGKGHG